MEHCIYAVTIRDSRMKECMNWIKKTILYRQKLERKRDGVPMEVSVAVRERKARG